MKQMKRYSFILLLILFTIFGLHSCKKDTTNKEEDVFPPYTPTPYSISVPQGFPIPLIPSTNLMTVEGVNLGHRLYYDPILSSNGMTCSFCHVPDKSFSSQLFTSNTGDHISIPPHINLAWNADFNWNGSQPVLEHLPLEDFGPDFFNTNMDTLTSRLMKHSLYPKMFHDAFGIQHIDRLSDEELKQYIVNSITQFLRSMVSSNSRYDKFTKHEINFTVEEIDGLYIFNSEKGDCFHCHGGPLFTTNVFSNNGLDSILLGQDQGRFLVTGNSNDRGKFSIPTLRNVALTAPYMHDGRFLTLQDVIDFYDHGVHSTSPNIDPVMTKPAKKFGLGLTPYEKSCLLKFLESLTDTGYVNNSAYTNPL
jgi:cytochrome c peroxidase